jgi:hypothetical protein
MCSSFFSSATDEDDRRCGVLVDLKTPGTFAENPLEPNFGEACPNWNTSTRVAQWDEHPDWYFEMMLYMYNPPHSEEHCFAMAKSKANGNVLQSCQYLPSSAEYSSTSK